MANSSDFTCWVLDTRPLWRGTKIQDSASRELALVSPEERKSILSKLHLADAKMSLASALLKRAFISKTIRTTSPTATADSWPTMSFSRRPDPTHGKPCYPTLPDVDFNITHQAGLVALIGTTLPDSSVGVDITCVDERGSDDRTIARSGLASFLDIFAEVFSPAELRDMKYSVDRVIDAPSSSVSSASASGSAATVYSAADLGTHARYCHPGGGEAEKEKVVSVWTADGFEQDLAARHITAAKLRRFYAFYAYKEAYIKMVGEGLLATWLRELEFRGVRVPMSVKQRAAMERGSGSSGDGGAGAGAGPWGERIGDAEAWMRGERVVDVRLEIRAFEEDKMIATAVRRLTPTDVIQSASDHHHGLPAFKLLDLERDVLAHATEA